MAETGLPDAALEVVADPEAYLRSARDLVLDEASVAHRVAKTPFESIPFCLSFKCDQCLYNEFCLKWKVECGARRPLAPAVYERHRQGGATEGWDHHDQVTGHTEGIRPRVAYHR